MRPKAFASLLAAAFAIGTWVPAPMLAQQPADGDPRIRRPLIGVVVDGDGQPIGAAEVVMALIAVADDGYDTADRLTATTDPRGRFRIDALPCAAYRGFAIGPVDDQGFRSASEVVACSTGAMVEFRCASRCRALELQVEGVEAWQERAPLTLRILPDRIDIASPLPIPEAGRVRLPILPIGTITAEILDRDGQPLQSSTFHSRAAEVKRLPAETLPGSATGNSDEDDENVGHDRGKSDGTDPAAPKPLKVTLRPPQRIPFVVVDEQGKPLAGAVVRQRIAGGWTAPSSLLQRVPSRSLWRDLGTTDQEGRLEAQIANADDPFQHKGWQSLFFLAAMPGRMVSWAGWTDNPYCDGKEVDGEGLTELQFVLRPQEPLRGSVMDAAGRPLASQRVVVHANIKIEDRQRNGWTHDALTRVLTTDEAGRFAFDDIPPTFDAIDVQLLASNAGSDLIPAKQRRCAPPTPIALHPIPEGAARELQLDLAKTHLLELQLLDKSRGPGCAVDVLFLSLADDDTDCTDWTPCTTTDNAGRVALRLQAGKWLLVARGEHTVAHHQLDVQGDQRVELRLEPMPAVRGRVVDAAGSPIAGARLRVRGSSWHSHGGVEQGLVRVARTFNWEWIRRTTSDADGNFECAYLAVPGTEYEVEFEHGKRTSSRFQLATEGEPITVTIE